MKKLLFVFSLMIALSGCSNTSGLDAVSGKDRYSGDRTVSIQPHGAACETTQCIMVGAFWTESHKDMALLTISLANTADFIRSADVEIDGKKYQLRDDSDLTRYDSQVIRASAYIQSSKDFLVPLSMVKDITKSKKVWIFVRTGTGQMSNAIIDAQGDSKAYYALQRFVAALPK